MKHRIICFSYDNVFVVLMLSCLCAAFNALVYQVPNEILPTQCSSPISNTAVLIAISFLLATANGVLSDLIAGWILKRIGTLPPKRERIVKTTVVIVFAISVCSGILLAAILR